MGITVYVIDPDPVERKWIESVLARSVEAVVCLESVDSLLADPPAGAACLITSAEPGEQGALEILLSLRRRGMNMPVIALGPHTAFRTAVDIARVNATDFLERPISDRELRAAVRRACKDSARSHGKTELS
jgi:FixJ family two-component response regulator